MHECAGLSMCTYADGSVMNGVILPRLTFLQGFVVLQLARR
jgi:hypothetical protein